MAPKALLPGSKKINPVKLLGGGSSADKIKPESLSTGNGGSITISTSSLFTIKEKLINVSDLLKDSTLLQKKELENLRKQKEKKKFKEREEKLEEKPDEKKEKSGLIKAPKIGFLDRIKSFIFNILLGYVVYRLIPLLPKLIGFVKIIAPAFDFIVNISGALFNALVTFIDWGYKAVDSVRGFIKNVGGDRTLELFDKFTGAFATFVNGALILSMIILKSRGLWKTLIGEGAKKGAAGILGRGVGRAGTRLGISIAGKAGGMAAQGVTRTLSKVLQKIPIIGGLIDFGINILLGEDPGRAAARAAGATAGGALGGLVAGAIGSVVPFAGTFLGGVIGSALGGWMGDWAGGALYDAFAGASAKMATGGPATRGGRLTGGVRRTVKKSKAVRRVTAKPTKVKPGADVGGEKVIKKIFPEQKDDQTMSPLKYMEKSHDATSEIPFFGPFFAIATKVLLGEKPSTVDYDNIGSTLSAWMQRTFSSDVMRTGGAFASGGSVDSAMFMGGEDLTKVISKSVEESSSAKIDESINELMKQLGLKEYTIEREKTPGQQPMVPGEDLGGDASDAVGGARLFMAAGFPMLAAAILAGNVQAESAWKGQRTPWVLNDGAGTNKGLISWNRTRITNAEKFLGKPLEKASNAEQVKWIKEELKQYGLLDEFLDPKSTEEQLKRASYKYIGWGIEGDRWKQSARILAALQRGEKGTFTPGGGGSSQLGKGYGSAGSKIAGELGRFIYQRLKTPEQFLAVKEHPEFGGVKGTHANKSFHYEGRAIDIGAYSWEQGPILKVISDFNRMKGVRPVELLKAGDPGHSDHVHVAYFGGGFVGRGGNITTHPGEYVIDKDSVDLFGRRFMDILNDTENISQRRSAAQSLMQILSTYAGYEFGATQEVEVEDSGQNTIVQPIPIPMGDSFGGGGSGGFSDPYESISMSQ